MNPKDGLLLKINGVIGHVTENGTHISEFILLGFQVTRNVEITVFVLLLVVYIIILLGNMLILLVIVNNSSLHTPMYLFIAHFSTIETLNVTTIVPKLLDNLLLKCKAISYFLCMLQSWLYFSLGATELILLAIMSIDRYIAICKPLHYSTMMSGIISKNLAIGCWCAGFLAISGPSILMLRKTFCNNIINHFFCDSSPLIRLSCTKTLIIEFLNVAISTVIVFSSLSVIIITYSYIIILICKISTVTARKKAFSTCASHLILVTLGYGGTIFIYVTSTNSRSLETNKAVSVINIIITPLLSPFIFTLRNENVKEAIKATISRNVKIVLSRE